MDWDVLLQDPTGHSLATNPWAPKALLIALTVINSCLAWSAHQADTWWPWYMEHTHIINMNFGGQALDILLDHTESAQKNITVKAHTHSHIYSNIQTELNNNKSENSPNLVYKYSTELSILLQEVISMASPAKKSSVWPPLPRVYLNSGSPPAVHPRYLLTKSVLKEAQTQNEYLFSNLCENLQSTDQRIN